MKTMGIAFIIAGTFALIYGGLEVERQKTVLDVGPFMAPSTEHRSIPLSPVAGGMAVISGLVLLILPRRQVASRG